MTHSAVYTVRDFSELSPAELRRYNRRTRRIVAGIKRRAWWRNLIKSLSK